MLVSCNVTKQIEEFLDLDLQFGENNDKICVSDEYLSGMYSKVNDYLLYKYFQRFGNPSYSEVSLGDNNKEEYE